MRTWTDALFDAAVLCVFWLAALLGLLALSILLHRLVADRDDRLQSARRKRYEESAALLVAGELEPLLFLRRVRRQDRVLAEAVLLEYAGRFGPDVRSHLSPVFEGLGAVARRRRQTTSRLWWQRAEAAKRLGLMHDPGVARSVRLLLRDRHAEVRISAARALLELGITQWNDDVIQSLADPHTFSSLRIADVVLDAGQSAIPGLIRFLRSKAPPAGKAVALNILGDIRAREAFPVILEQVGSSWPEVRAAACRALGRLENPTAVEHLVGALGDHRWEVRNQAVRALGAIGDPSAVPHLLPLLQEAEPWTVYRSARALTELGTEGVRAVQDRLFRLQDDQHIAGDHRIHVLQEVLSRRTTRG